MFNLNHSTKQFLRQNHVMAKNASDTALHKYVLHRLDLFQRHMNTILKTLPKIICQ